MYSAFIACCFLLLFLPVQAQELSYRQYTIKEGLSGSIVYHSLQDANGFIWFATNQGVSRFDGRSFKNFTRKDGLPDNDIIKLYIDKHNTVWFISLSGVPAVYYKGVIRSLNYPGVSAIEEDKLTDSIFLLGRYVKNNISYYGYYSSFNEPGKWAFANRFRKALRMEDVFNLPMLRASGRSTGFYYSLISHQKGVLVIKKQAGNDTSLQFSNNFYIPFTSNSFVSALRDKNAVVFHNFNELYYADSSGIQQVLSLKKIGINIDKETDLSSLYFENDSTVWLCTRNKGLIKITHFLKPEKTFQYYFVNSFCTSILKDAEGGYWLTTHNEGVFYLPNLFFYTLSGHREIAAKDVRCIKAIDAQNLAAGFADGTIIKIRHADKKITFLEKWTTLHKNNRILDINPRGKDLVIASDGGLYNISAEQVYRRIFKLGGIKGFLMETDSTFVIATAAGLQYHKLGATTSQDIYSDRVTCIAGSGSQYYWGTLQGAYKRSGDTVIALGKNNPVLSGVINYITLSSDASQWIATQQGIAIIKNGITHVIKEENGLLSNTCRHLLLDGNTAWAATDKGIARIDFRWQGKILEYTVINITENDGLISNDINQLAAGGQYIWAATVHGIAFFSRNFKGNATMPPFIVIDRVVAGNKVVPAPDTVHLDYLKNNLTVEIAGVAYHNAGNIHYQYRLKGLDSSWYPVVNNSISFSALPYGQYKLEIGAFDRTRQAIASSKGLVIINQPPFWKSAWFMVLVYLISTLLLGMFFYFFYRKRQQRREQVHLVNKKIHELEVMALRAQMNPHFIFNCLNSIQHYIFTSDVVNANLYLHRFSLLIRKTLQVSPSSLISLREEIELLELYLQLEQMRLDDRMEYQLIVQKGINPEEYYIPPLIIQPYVENAVKHGITPLRDRKGNIRVEFRIIGNDLECLIEDNGIGIRSSLNNRQANTHQHISMGQSITEGRVQAMNSIREKKIILRIMDRQDANPPAVGSFVQIIFPIETDNDAYQNRHH